MQKKLIALAIASLSGAAFAQSNVTIYGAMGLGQESVQATGATAGAAADVQSRGRLASNSSLLGFKGSEKLGNGLTAVFQYETAFVADTAGALGGGRDTYLGLAGGFGTVAAGTLTHPMRVLGAKVDHNPAASSIGFTGSMYGEFNGLKTGTDERAGNAIAYISPTISGFHGVFAYVNGEAKTAVVDSSAWQIAGVYDQGPLFLGMAYHTAEDPAVLGAIDSSFKAVRVAGTYTLAGATKLSALWDSQEAKFKLAGTNAKRTAWMLGAAHTMGANQIYVQYARANDVTGSAGAVDTGSKQMTVGFAHSMSKRTTAHAYYSKITNEAAAGYDFYVNGVGTAAGGDPAGYGVGLRHSF